MSKSCVVFLLTAGLLLAGCAQAPSRDAYRRFVSENRHSSDFSPVSSAAQLPEAPAGPELSESSTLADYLAYAAYHSPELEAAFAAWKAAVERIPQARSLPDPRFTYRYYIRTVETRVGPQRNAYELTQTFPWIAKLELRGDVASRQAMAARHRFDTVRLKLFYRVQKVYAEYYYLGRATDLTGQNVELLEQIEATARNRYTVGGASHPDVIRSQVELGKLADRVRTLEQLRSPAAARLNAAMNRPADAPIPWPSDLPNPQEDYTQEELLAWAAEANPEARALQSEVDARQAGVDLARQEYVPDLTIGVNYIDTEPAHGNMPVRDSGQDPVIVMASVNLPIWWDRIAAGVREAKWKRLAAVAGREAYLNTLSADVAMALFEFQDAGRKIGLYRDTLVPKAEQALQAAQGSYRTGGVGFQSYLDAQRVLLEFQLSYERSLANRAQRLAELEMLVGKPLGQQ